MFITALDDLESKRKGFYSGVDDYMVKPVDMDEMAAYVKRRGSSNSSQRV
mgnify:CR=1 FL=1